MAYKCWTPAPYTLTQAGKEGNSKTKRLVYRPILLYPLGHSSPGSSIQKSPVTHGHSKEAQGCLRRQIFSSGFTNILTNITMQRVTGEERISDRQLVIFAIGSSHFKK